MTTKDKILQAALKLFNESNTQAATTNHIAKEAGISPGNLHYHYKNREEIIRALYEKMRAALKVDPSLHPMTILELDAHHELIFETLWEYRFFYRELLFLLSRDADLKAIYIRETVEHKRRIIAHLKRLAADRMLEIPFENVYEQMADSILLIFQFWNVYTETLGETVTIERLSLGVVRLQEVLRPFLTSEALRLLGKESQY